MRCQRTLRQVRSAGLRPGFAIIYIRWRDRDFLDQSGIGVRAHMSLVSMHRRPALVFDPARLVIAFARGGNDGGVDQRSCLDLDRSGLGVSGNLVEQPLVQA